MVSISMNLNAAMCARDALLNEIKEQKKYGSVCAACVMAHDALTKALKRAKTKK